MRRKIRRGPPPPPPPPSNNPILTGKWANIPKWLSETLDSAFEELGEMFEDQSADTCGGKFLLVSMGGRSEGLACADPGARIPIGANRNYCGFPFEVLFNSRSSSFAYFKLKFKFQV